MSEGRIVILGAGNQASVVLDILQADGLADRVEGLIETGDGPPRTGQLVDEVPIIGGRGDLEAIHSQGVHLAVLAVGTALAREQLFKQAIGLGFGLVSAIHPSAIISDRVKLGRGVTINPLAVIMTGAQIGDGVIINTAATVDHHGRIDDFAHVAPGACLGGNVHVGARTWVGLGASVIQGVTIGRDSFIGAGAVVVGDLPERVLAFGVPARVVRPYDPAEGIP